MFVQVIEGKTSGSDSLSQRMELWDREVRPGAVGFLGATSGVGDDGRAVIVARFESEAAARANSDRPEQGEWWAGTEPWFAGEVQFSESDDVDTIMGGGSDDAGFVQIMRTSNAKREQVQAMDALMEEHATTIRPDVIGGQRIWTGPYSYVQVTYFTSEAEARAGETREYPAELSEQIEAMGEFLNDVEFLDLRDPLLA